MLHSGHSLPQSGDTTQHGEGVAIMLDSLMVMAWRDSGKHDLL